MKLDSKKCIYIGDTEGDFNASRDNNIDFIFAKYGYGDSKIKFLNEINDISDLDIV
jgi:phosphoglycolate phosphatase